MSQISLRSLFVHVVCTLLLCGSAAAQDSHYWSEKYGTRSELLGGAVVGSPQDLSTTFYNPGGLTRLETPSFLISAQAFEYQWLDVEDPTGNFEDLWTDRFGVAPTLFAGTFPRDWVSGTLAYSVLTRQKSEFRIDSWGNGADLDSDGETVIANMLIDTKSTETWGGLTWGGDVGAVGIGASLYGALRNQRGRFEYLYQPMPTGAPGLVLASVDDYSYWHVRMLAKAGAYWQRDRLSLGITLTTPGLPLFGSGDAAYYRSLVFTDSTGVPEITEGGAPDDVSVTYRSPSSIAIGTRYGKPGNAVYVTIEWFHSVDPYQVLSTPDAPESGLGSTLRSRTTQESASVVNVAIGYEYSPRNRLTFFGSFLTNFTSAVDNRAASHSVSTWDIYQFTIGTAFKAASVDFTLGGSFAFGNDEITRLTDIPEMPLFDISQVRYRKLKVFIGFEFGS